MLYKTIVADPPWMQPMMPALKRRPKTAVSLPYPTMTVKEIAELPIRNLADTGCHLWLWTTNKFLHDAFHIMDSWGFTYMQTLTWVKTSGCGIYWVNTTQHLLFGYFEKCYFHHDKLKPTHFITPPPRKHSEKPAVSYNLIESISDMPRLELFARNKRQGWAVWGNEVKSDISLSFCV